MFGGRLGRWWARFRGGSRLMPPYVVCYYCGNRDVRRMTPLGPYSLYHDRWRCHRCDREFITNDDAEALK